MEVIYKEAPLKKQIEDLGLGDYAIITEQDYCPEQREMTFRPEHFALLVITSGEMHLRFNQIRHQIASNSLFIISPNHLYEFEYVSEDFKFYAISFTHKFLNNNGLLFSSAQSFDFFTPVSNPHFPLGNEQFRPIVDSIELLRSKIKNASASVFYKQMANSSFLALMYEVASICAAHMQIKDIKINRKEDITRNFMKMLTLHFRQERSVQYYADQLHVTPRHLSEVVKEIIGMTAGELIDVAVISEARTLLADPSKTVAMVSDELCFSDQSFFGKYFKKHVGVSPSEFRNNFRNHKQPTY
jgi:AraC family transcriptional activator of pobA